MQIDRPGAVRVTHLPTASSPTLARRVLVWQWGRRGGGPRFAAELARGLAEGGAEPLLSLSARAELLAGPHPPDCALAVDTYGSLAGVLWRLASAPALLLRLWRRLGQLRPELAICAMAGPLDLIVAGALALRRIPFALVVHEAEAHPGDAWRVQYRLQLLLARRARLLVALTSHVAGTLVAQGVPAARILVAEHPPFAIADARQAPRAHGGPLRVLLFGRLLRYKGLDLLADALDRLGARDDLVVRVVGQGPATPVLERLRAQPGVTVENRWVPEQELDALFAWSDVVLLSHTQASQSGVAAAALGARRWLIATRVGGLPEQLAGAPGALLCAPEPDALAAALRNMLGRPAAAVPGAETGDRWRAFGQRVLRACVMKARGRCPLDPHQSSALETFTPSGPHRLAPVRRT